MCGLVGIAGLSIVQKDTKVFEQMLIADVFRGKHSTGIASVFKGVCEYYKRALTSPDFLQLEQADDLVSVQAQAIIGHNRHATAGKVNDTNAHPFQHGDITLVHNGTLSTQVGLPSHDKFDVDSENICYALSQLEPKEVLEKLEGAYALVWHDAADNTLHFARNDERPLHLAIGGGVLYWASEVKMLEWILNRNKISIKENKELPVGNHIAFDLSQPLSNFGVACIDEEFTVKDDYSGWYNMYGGKSRGGYNGYHQAANRAQQETLPDYGYTLGEEVTFVADVYESYGANSIRGSLSGYAENNKSIPIIVYGVLDEDVKLLPGTIIPDPNYLYTAQASALTWIKNSSVKAVSLRSDTLAVSMVQPEKKHYASSSEDLHIIDGVPFTEEEVQETMDIGCAWCGNPLSRLGALGGKVNKEGWIFHKHVCWDEYNYEAGTEMEATG